MNTLTKQTTNDALAAHGLDFEVYQLPMKAIDDVNNLEIETDLVANCRLLDGTPKILGHVGKRYTVLQNVDAFKVFDPIFENGLATIENAGCFQDGRKVFIEARVNVEEMEVLPGDVVRPYILLANSFDGSLAVYFGFTPKRVACLNSLHEAISSKKSKLAKVRHKANIVMNLERIRETMDFINQRFIMTVEQYRELAKIVVNANDFKQYVRNVFNQETETDRKSRLIDDLERLFETSPGSAIPGVKGTAWGAYNAVSSYLQFERGNPNNQEKRMDNLWFGTSGQINEKALTQALALR